jgi:hypothetical protein
MSEEDLVETEVEETLDAVAEEDHSAEAGESESQAEEVSEYAPDFTYKVKDEEFEFDDFLKNSLTSSEQEEALRDLYTRSRGLDGYKERLTGKEKEYNELMGETNLYVDGYKNLKKHVTSGNETGNLREIQVALGMDEDAIIKYAGKLLKERDLPEHEKTLLHENRNLKEKLISVESRMGQFENDSQDAKQQQFVSAIQTSVQQHPDGMKLNEVMSSVGKNMMEELYHLGDKMNNAGLKPRVGDVVSKLVEDHRYLLELEDLRNNKQQQPLSEPDIANKPTLPTVKGNNTAAVRKELTSLADIRALAKSMG